MPNAEKIEKVAALKERIQGAEALLLAEYRGLSVHDATELRRSLSDTARFSVVKNTLMQRAAGEAGVEELATLLTGPTAVAFVDGDVVAAAKKVMDAAKRFPALVLKGALLEGNVLDQAAAQALATLESREVMLSKFAGMAKSELVRAASMFQALQGRFLGLLEAFREKLPSPEDEPATGEEPAAGQERVAETVAEAEAAVSEEPETPAEAGSAGMDSTEEAEASGAEQTSEEEPSESTQEE